MNDKVCITNNRKQLHATYTLFTWMQNDLKAKLYQE